MFTVVKRFIAYAIGMIIAMMVAYFVSAYILTLISLIPITYWTIQIKPKLTGFFVTVALIAAGLYAFLTLTSQYWSPWIILSYIAGSNFDDYYLYQLFVYGYQSNTQMQFLNQLYGAGYQVYLFLRALIYSPFNEQILNSTWTYPPLSQLTLSILAVFIIIFGGSTVLLRRTGLYMLSGAMSLFMAFFLILSLINMLTSSFGILNLFQWLTENGVFEFLYRGLPVLITGLIITTILLYVLDPRRWMSRGDIKRLIRREVSKNVQAAQ